MAATSSKAPSSRPARGPDAVPPVHAGRTVKVGRFGRSGRLARLSPRVHFARFTRLARLAALALSGFAALLVANPARAGLGGAPMATPAGASVSVLSAASAAAAATPAIASAARQAAQNTAATEATEAAAAAQTGASSGAAAPYHVQQTTLASGTVVREYVSPAGTVFGVGWNGPQMPDLAALLGSYFPQYVAGVQARRAAGAARGPGVVEQDGLVVHSGGHMGGFSGQAWLPQALPAGVGAADIQ